MQEIYKYEVEIGQRNVVKMPENAQILSVQMQHGIPVIWALVDPQFLEEKRRFEFVGTGHDIEFDTTKYIGTVQLNNGAFIFHLFEV